MKLSNKDGELFYELWFALLNFVNEKYDIIPTLEDITEAEELDPNDVKEIADELWADVSAIDEYLDDCGDQMPEEHKEIIRSWKQRIKGDFIIEKYLDDGAAFISLDEEQIYLVKGILNDFDEIFGNELPIMVDATIIPFRYEIITDGLVISYNMEIGNAMVKEFEEIYNTAEQNGLLIKSL